MHVTLLGFGNMGSALALGILERGFVERAAFAVVETDSQKAGVARSLGVSVFKTSTELAEALVSDTILICAVKPQQAVEALSPLRNKLGQHARVVSIMAGVACSRIVGLLGDVNTKVARAMPNLPACYGKGMTGIYFNGAWVDTERASIKDILSSVGLVLEVESEAAIDSVTAISGSGPAYYYLLTEALVKAARNLGFSEFDADLLASQTFIGAAEHIARTQLPAATLRQMVTSPGGTTEAALEVLGINAFSNVVESAVTAAVSRARDLR